MKPSPTVVIIPESGEQVLMTEAFGDFLNNWRENLHHGNSRAVAVQSIVRQRPENLAGMARQKSHRVQEYPAHYVS